MTTRIDPPTADGAAPLRWFRYVALLTAALVVIQAALAGRGFFIDYDLIKIHGDVGSVTFLACVVLVFIAVRGYRTGALDRYDLIISGLLLILIAAQLGLGYGGRDSKVAASLHWPNGVLITALTAVLLGRTLPHRT